MKLVKTIYYSFEPEICFDVASWAKNKKMQVINLSEEHYTFFKNFLSCNKSLLNEVYFNYENLHKNQSLICIEGAIIRDGLGLVELPDGKILYEGNWWLPYLTSSKSFKRLFDYKSTKTLGNCYSLLCLWGNQYYHWFFDVLPRLEAALPFLPNDTIFLINEKPSAFQLESLAAYGINEDRLICQPNRIRNKIQRLWFATPAGHTGFTNPDLLKKVGSRMVNHFKKKFKNETVVSENIYVSRMKAASRRVVNEEGIIHVLKSHKIHVMNSEDYNFSEQVNIFSGAKKILGPHGAGLANMIFMPDGDKVVEIVSNQHPSCYHVAAISTGKKFLRFKANRSQKNNNDMIIDYKSFDVLIKKYF